MICQLSRKAFDELAPHADARAASCSCLAVALQGWWCLPPAWLDVSPMALALHVSVFTVDFRIVVVRVEGVLDMDSYPVLQVRLAEALTFHRPPLVAVDVSGVPSADSFGLSVLIAAEQHVHALVLQRAFEISSV
ncbi:STAS domain-containing protein [Nonomuraea sp. NPDC049758]|uniref:STAS domain-containing protein n=1 Tax=Nonomuraea sp. NPDC049758 TaxID=3154360 RepID=UPI0034438D5F